MAHLGVLRAVGLGALLLLGPGPGRAQPNGAMPQPPTPAYRVVVHPANPASTVDRRFLSQAFLRKTSGWGHGEAIRPVDLAPDSPVRRRFSDDVHGRSVAAVKSYWQQVIFSGRGLPPPELSSDDDVLRFVNRHRGAIGYVSGAADVRAVKILAVR